MTGVTPNKADQAFLDIERMIVLQDLPPGTLVSEKQLMERTGLGRTPVREALQRLARERLVEIHPNRGVLVPAASIEAQLKLLELRRTLEPFAVRLAATRATPDQRSTARRLADHVIAGPLSVDDFARFLRSAHALVVNATHNEFVEVAMAPLQGLSRRFWFGNMTSPSEDLGRAAQLHHDILASIADGDGDAAEAASLALSDYLFDFAYSTLPQRNE
ncbi:GntR family transcriptional regulator [Mycolicibacterium vaccae]|jgi:DNA-binding GntR family transcriptional regulator|uniref:GntR family transcriptional regulator n=1 Tax=Mycolicibacterium vaccae ATCC 25954 TaxID=1194972 RepID=K0V6J4_MYCVA|nr:GntR family transcriptional regulator [Mycolicibacterium vaccae]ANI41554.1 GntR family transcriptional regulator [Mycolicibacterium vaccae 95051]EJZ06664.1 GntR family transcriptional regulator [Mycolicibacterium vaccae ATCC 25954]MCV7062788.1 GntR family transcriptional regulator [Mycolicibacterium vaccae]